MLMANLFIMAKTYHLDILRILKIYPKETKIKIKLTQAILVIVILRDFFLFLEEKKDFVNYLGSE